MQIFDFIAGRAYGTRCQKINVIEPSSLSDAFDVSGTFVDSGDLMDASRGANCGASGLLAFVPVAGWALSRRRKVRHT
ncbi:MAG: hypothetical protein H6818_13305 [Phycisphaerales bacterium]|nr:hypothetical protein [Phycisphaerales bacterium]